MKLWNIEPLKNKLSFGEIDAVVLGEEGRARKKVIIPFQAKKDIDSNRYNIGYTRNQYPKIIEGESSDGWIAKLSGFPFLIGRIRTYSCGCFQRILQGFHSS